MFVRVWRAVSGFDSVQLRSRTRAERREQAVSNIDVVNNKLPGRPCKAFFTPSTDTSASSVFEALDKANITHKDI